MRKLEIACFNAESARIAAWSGADRIELCSAIQAGGLTPDIKDLIVLKTEISIPLFVMIRPHGRSFVYDADDIAHMKEDMDRFSTLADGFVFGMLTASGDIDPRNAELVASAQKPCTFHRAFDQSRNLPDSLESIIDCGFSTLLTSGGKGNATGNLEALQNLVILAGDRICIMPGGGVRSGNIDSLKTTGATWYHSSGIVANGDTASGAEISMLNKSLRG